ncbi:hypothetical protein [Capnocytophaga stomatis]|uniref:DoxX family protein n=1 Tax=Capnocytophaga stomatis TaxID=1848904 RepID=A0A250FY81_9FLAO|nr:hypothetical protein [Capnocytophaga stomatis]ATA89038.1 hypothetical protein CGC58_04500 [Capnocytophaga stomatis]GIJ94280.1 hypothetical protein CAPN002_14980 [Capnocytophaga stomatis]GIJ97793.1 hypothetical protein CAPN001_23620 [Capnocytophaga stomatis]
MDFALLFVFLFLIITFGYSAFEKIINFKESVIYYKNYLSETFLEKYITLILFFVIVAEVISTILFLIGIFEVFSLKSVYYGFYGLVITSSTLLCFLFGQRLAKDYEGARGIAIYFIICLIGFLIC